MCKANSISMLGVACGLVAMLAAVPARADVCHDVDLAVQNNKGMKIEALNMEYLFANDNQWRTQGFGDEEVAAGAFKTVAFDKDLAGAEGNELLSLRLHFKAWCGGKWSVEFVSVEDTDFDNTAPCASFSGRSYRLDLPSSDVCD